MKTNIVIDDGELLAAMRTRNPRCWRRCATALMGIEDLKDVVERDDLSPPRLRLLNGDRFLDPRRFVGVRNGSLILRADYSEVVAAVERDCTLVVDNVGLLIPSIQHMCDWFKDRIWKTPSANLYCAQHSLGRFGPHYDQHHVLAVQLAGSKRWVFPNEPVATGSEISSEIVIEQGDAIFVPEGVIHDVSAVGNLSIHVSISLS